MKYICQISELVQVYYHSGEDCLVIILANGKQYTLIGDVYFNGDKVETDYEFSEFKD